MLSKLPRKLKRSMDMFARTLPMNTRNLIRRRREKMASTIYPISSRSMFTSHPMEVSKLRSMWDMRDSWDLKCFSIQ